ncbi:hypothetical protein [Paraburkholderia hospita]|nr:hypothetical protein [Paraburkholderia hospita]
MKSKRLTCVAAVAATLLSLSGVVHANGPTCSNETLRGPYGFSAQGEILGIIGTDGAVHYAKSRLLLNDVAIVNFDGNGNFTRNDAGNIGGLPKMGGAFNSVQFGTYKVNSDCTGTMTINYGTKASPAGVVLVVNIVVSSDATLVMGEMTSETVPFAAAPPTSMARVGARAPKRCKSVSRARRCSSTDSVRRTDGTRLQGKSGSDIDTSTLAALIRAGRAAQARDGGICYQESTCHCRRSSACVAKGRVCQADRCRIK